MLRERQTLRWLADHAPRSPRNALAAPTGPYGDPFIPALSGILTSGKDATVTILPSISTPYAGDDAVFINAAWDYATTVQLIDGLSYNVLSPVVVPAGRSFKNTGNGVSQSVAGMNNNLGATLKVNASWTAAGQPVSGAIILPTGTRQSLHGIDIDLRSAPASVDGISMNGQASGAVIERVGINSPTGNGLAIYNSGGTQDGMLIKDCVINNATGDGLTGKTADVTMVNVHVQGCTGRGFYLTGSNTRLLGCRADSNAHGFVTDVFYSDGGGFTLVGCGTQSNVGHGVWAWNSSTNGNSPRQPVTVSGGTFYGDGTDGASAAIQASGAVTLIVSDPQILVDTNLISSPLYGVGTEKIGGGAAPVLVQVWGGLINATTALVHDVAPAQLMSYKFHGVLGAGSWNGNASPASPTLQTLNA